MVEIVVKIMAELLSTLALVTKELQQRRSSEYLFSNVLPYSARCSQICEDIFRGQGR
jgi:hypothetical protein